MQEIEKSIFPQNLEVVSNIQTQKAHQRKNAQKLNDKLQKHGDALHTEIDTKIQSKQAEIDIMETKQEDAVNNKFTEI